MSDFQDFLEQHHTELADFAHLATKEIPDDPVIALRAMRKLASVYSRALSLLADIEGYLTTEKWAHMEKSDLPPMKAKQFAEAQVADITRLRDKVEGNCKGILEQINVAKKVCASHEKEYQNGAART